MHTMVFRRACFSQAFENLTVSFEYRFCNLNISFQLVFCPIRGKRFLINFFFNYLYLIFREGSFAMFDLGAVANEQLADRL